MTKAIEKKKGNITDVVLSKVNGFKERGQLHMPADYSPENALKSAYLILQETKDKNKKPVLESCNQSTLANALLDMVVQGLNPAKKQCYFIAYGKSLNLQRSYFGDMAVMKRLNDIHSVNANVVYKDDEFSVNINPDGSKEIEHKTSFKSLSSDIVGAYAVVNFTDGRRHIEIMDWDMIVSSWKQSKTNPVDSKGKVNPNSTHGKFPEEMAKRTVIRRACKMYINTSNDNDLVIESFNRTTENEYKEVESEVEYEIEHEQATEEIEAPEPKEKEESEEISKEEIFKKQEKEYPEEPPF